MTERQLPDEPPNDDFEWTAEPGDPDMAGMAGEFVNDSGESVPGVRREEDFPDFNQESNN